MAKKRSPDFPLRLHGNGQWSRKVRGRLHYFGTDRDEALRRWVREKDHILAGLDPPRKSASPSLSELANVYIADRREQSELTGKPGRRHLDLCETTIRRLIGFVGADCRPADLSPSDFASIRRKLFEPVKRSSPAKGGVFGRQVARRSPETVAGDVRRIKAFLNWCHSREHIPAPRYGQEFATEIEVAHTKESLRRAKARRDFDADEIRRMIELASARFKPIVLLAINAGIGNLDIAEIEWDDIDGIDRADPWIDLPRLKTGAPRRFPVWPETVESITAYMPKREQYAGRKHADKVFLTSHGLPWVRDAASGKHSDTIGTTFTKLRKAAGLNRGTFYDLRRTFATVASKTLDKEAVRFVMGHKKDKRDMLARYDQGIDNDRIRRVCEYVRDWLFAPDEKI